MQPFEGMPTEVPNRNDPRKRETIMIDVGYACGYVDTLDGVVIEAPPIYAWMKNKTWAFCRRWVEKHGTWKVINAESV